MATATTPTHTGVAGIYNDSTTFRLAVWSVAVSPLSAQGLQAFGVQLGALANSNGQGTVIWTNQGSIAGRLCNADLVTPGTQIGIVNGNFGGGFYDSFLPLFILDPGWCLFTVASAAAMTFAVMFLWEELNALAFMDFEQK